MAFPQNTVAWITGSSRGIGAAIAKAFALRGARVALHGRDEQALSSVRAEIERAGGRAISVAGDVTRFSDIEAMRIRIENELGPVEVLVANAGGSFPHRAKPRTDSRSATSGTGRVASAETPGHAGRRGSGRAVSCFRRCRLDYRRRARCCRRSGDGLRTLHVTTGLRLSA